MEFTNLIAVRNIKNILKNGENYPTRNSPINILKDVVNLVKNLLTIYLFKNILRKIKIKNIGG